ncbi:SHOCT domain-containing protein [Pseudoxanthomonas sp. USHLN014]|uniref:SHOCT domain-containing protein n=1 Tax=Pseudoxanthomonas sp. USHLN014 TaxID=3081297 RepID=UPI00301C727D
MKRILICGALLAIAPEVTAGKPQITPISRDTYMAVVENHAGIFGSESTTKRKALEAANAFAQSKGMEIQPVAMEYRGAGGPGQWPAAEYQFRLVPPGAGSPVGLKRRADVEVSAQGSAPAPQPSAAEKPDLYTELMKLDDLRKRGILSDAEFEQQKAILLAHP